MESFFSRIKRLLGHERMPVAAIAAIVCFLFLWSAPRASYPQYFQVGKGEGLSQIADHLADQGLVRHGIFFRLCSTAIGGARRSMAGLYEFDAPASPCAIAWRITGGIYSLNPVKVTIPEGFLKKEIAARLSVLPGVNAQDFLARAPEGYLFPDTYFFIPNMNATDVITTMTGNFQARMAPFAADIAKSKRAPKDIVIIASLVEREAKFPEDRPLVAQVLWKRLDMKMPLQVDSSFEYVNGKGTFELSSDDLKIDLPYNTYTHAGLPPGPVGNPGLDALKAAISPATTTYVYFLSDKAGHMHFAKTFAEHQLNREKYLGR